MSALSESWAAPVFRRMIPKRVRRWIVRRVRPVRPAWVISEPAPEAGLPLEHFALYAIVGTWMEADIIAETVANAFAQGVDRVFLVDNDSPDDTVEQATAAGAEHVLTYRTSAFEEQYRYGLMNEFVRHTSVTSDFDHVWWLWLDADEFPRPADGGTLRTMLADMDQRFRIVGARFINHYPTPGEVAHVAGEHPIGHQPMCEEFPLAVCAAMHRKHPLQRWDRVGPRIETDLGFHRAICEHRPLLEPVASIVIHHFPFRNEANTRRRLSALWDEGDDAPSRAKFGDLATDHMEARAQSMDAVYAGDWANVHNFMPGAPPIGVDLIDWRDLVPPLSPDVGLGNC